MKSLKNKYLLISLIINVCITWLCLDRFYPSEGIPGMLYFIAILAQFSFLIIGPILFVFRISKFLKKENFFYIFVGIGNLWLSILSFLLYFMGRVQPVMIWSFLPNLAVGLLLIADLYWVRAPGTDTRPR